MEANDKPKGSIKECANTNSSELQNKLEIALNRFFNSIRVSIIN